MKRFNFNNYIYVLAFLFLFYACGDESSSTGPVENDSVAPAPISNVSVENLSGGAKLTYTLPDDDDLKEVRAEYTLSSGEEKEIKSSFYNNSLTIEGYADSTERQVKLFAVDRSENSSEPVDVTINPKRSDIYDVFNSLNIQAAFGGVQVDAENPNRRDVAILLMQENDLGELEPIESSIYTSRDKISSTIRGLDTLKQDYAVTVRDRFQNYTDTMYTEVTPLFETQLSDSKFTGYFQPGDNTAIGDFGLNRLWNGNFYQWPGVYVTKRQNINTPHRITFDLGQEARLSRIKIWDYPQYVNNEQVYYYDVCMKKFEIWGSTNPLDDGSFTNWTKLGTYTETKPSGLPYGEQSNEDYQTARAGFDWEFSLDSPRVRYIRIVNLENWSGTTTMGIAELQVFGDPR
jgi:hypothetical protein